VEEGCGEKKEEEEEEGLRCVLELLLLPSSSCCCCCSALTRQGMDAVWLWRGMASGAWPGYSQPIFGCILGCCPAAALLLRVSEVSLAFWTTSIDRRRISGRPGSRCLELPVTRTGAPDA